MTVFHFDTITEAQALGYSAATDRLLFTGVTAAQVAVSGAVGGITLTVGSRSVTFGAGFSTPLVDGHTTTGELQFPDGSKLRIGTAAGESLSGSPWSDHLIGGGGSDSLLAGDGGDMLSGGDGDDLIVGGAGNDTIDGGSGVDTVSYGSESLGVTASLFPSAGPGDRITNVENVIGSNFNDHLTGEGQANSIQGGAGDDTLDGGFGADTVEGGSGADCLQGGAGDDQIRGGAGADTLSGGDGAERYLLSAGEAAPTARDVILDWSSDDQIVTSLIGPYQETTAQDDAQAYAETLIAAGARFVAVETPSGVILYIDTVANGGAAEDAILLSGRTLADISAANVGAVETLPMAPPAPPTGPAPAPASAPPLPPTPALPSPLATTHGQVRGNMDTARLANLLDVPIEASTSTHLRIDAGAGPSGPILDLVGTGFIYDADDQLLGGTVREIIYVDNGGDFAAQLFVTGVSAAPFLGWVVSNATQTAFATILAGNDRFGGSVGADLLRGYGGNDHIGGGGGNDTIFGGLGDDQIFALFADPGPNISTGSTYLRGDEGNDYIIGAGGFDDINGNMGDDTAAGGVGDDWVVGGKDDDLLFGEAGHDLVYGNLGSDTCVGGAGNDVVRGGQNDDHIFGDAGDDYVSGDKGDDTVTGGAGADLFHTFGDAGVDRVTDFASSQGDRVLLDPGTQYTVAQSGADTVISMTGGGQMILVGVQMSSLPDGWIFGA